VSGRMLTGGGDFERYTFESACNEPVPNNWKNACRRVVGHGGRHHTWDPRTGTDKGRHPFPFYDEAGNRIAAVDAWGDGRLRETRMLRGHGAYVAPAETDRLMVVAIRAREPSPTQMAEAVWRRLIGPSEAPESPDVR
jgi:hypothetical protein